MNEELKIKLKVEFDESSSKASATKMANQVKKQVESTLKTVDTGDLGSSATQKTAANAKAAASEATKGINQMVNAIKKLKGISSFTDILEIGAEFGAAAVQSKIIADGMEAVEEQTKEVTEETRRWVKELREAIILARASGQDTSYTYTSGGKNNTEILRVDDVDTAQRLVDKFDNVKDAAQGIANATGAAGKSTGSLVGTTGKLAGIVKIIKTVWTAIKGVVATVAAYLAALIPVFIMLATVVKGVQAAFKVAPLGDEVYQSASKFGFSTKAYQEWGWVMERNGATIDDLTSFLETLGSEQASVITGSEEAAKKFENLGISAEEAMGMDSQRLFETTISKLQGIENATERAAYAYELFGDEASKLMNVINMSNEEMAEAVEQYNLLGGAMSGELVENSNRMTNSIAAMKQAWQGISNTLAEVFIPVVTKVINFITKAIVIVNLFLRTIFGLDLKPTADSTDKAASSTNKYTGGLKAAKKAAEELKRITMGFDELNIVSDPNKSSADTSANTGASFDMSGMPSLESGLLNMDDLNLDKIYEWFEEYKNVIKQVVTWSLLLIGILLAVIGGFTVNVPLILLGCGMVGLGIAVGIKSGAFEELAKGIKNVWNNLKEWFNTNVKPVFTKEYWTELWDKVKEAAAEKLDEIGQKIFGDKWDDIKQWFAENVAPKFTKQYWKDKFNSIKEGIKEKLDEVKTSISDKWNGVKTWFAEKVAPKFTKQYWKDKFNNIKEGIKEKLDEAKTAISDKWNGVKKWFSDNVGQKFTKKFWKEKFNSIPEGIKSAINSAIEAVEKGVNWIIKKINTLSWKVPDWVPAIGGKKWGFDFKEISIPRLATGGIATRSTIANIGEAGREAVLPLDNNTEWMDTLADKIAERNSAPSKIVLKVGEKEFAWAAINGINNVTKQTGSLQLAL